MKKIFLVIGIVCAGLSSCTDDDILGKQTTPAEPGDEIRFSAFQQESGYNDTDNPGTRAHYGLYTLNKEEGKYSIYWDDGDHIAIYCPQARATNSDPEDQSHGKEADYKILLVPNENEGESEQTMQSGTLSKINPSDVGLQWGETDMHDFFGFFPKDAKKGIIAGNKLKLNLPVLQTPSSMRVIEPNADGLKITLPNGEAVTGTTYIARPDMNSCFMYAHGQGSRIDNEQISLDFKPVVTTLEFIVKGPEEGEEPIEVSQVVLRSEKSITGSFSLQIGEKGTAEDGKAEAIDDGTLSNSVTIPVYYNHILDENGVGATKGDNLESVTLKSGDILVVRAFILPHTVATTENNAVTVHMVGAGSRTKLLKGGTIRPGTINIATLPKLKKSETNYWMSMLDPNVYFSQLSIPGTHNSYNIAPSPEMVLNNNTEIGSYYQTKTIQEQLAAGARAFSFQVGFATSGDKYYGNVTSYDGWQDDAGYPLYVYAGGAQTETTLTSVINTFVNELNSLNTKYESTYTRSAQEFIVLNVTYTERGPRANELPRWLKAVDYAIDNNTSGILTNDINEQTTISDLAKKIVIFVNFQDSNWPNERISNGAIWNPSYYSYSYNPSDAEKYVVVMDSYDVNGNKLDFSTANDRDYNYVFYQPVYGNGVGGNIRLYRQNLERLNNTQLTSDNVTWLEGRQESKKNMISDLFQRAVANNSAGTNVGNWYINNIGSFCVVDQEGSWGSIYGAGGNVPMAANLMNYYTYQYLANPSNNSAPCGVVLMNLFGESEVSGLNVYSTALQQIIIENNYRFPLKVRSGSGSGN